MTNNKWKLENFHLKGGVKQTPASLYYPSTTFVSKLTVPQIEIELQLNLKVLGFQGEEKQIDFIIHVEQLERLVSELLPIRTQYRQQRKEYNASRKILEKIEEYRK